MSTWEPVSPVGLSSTGFMRGSGVSLQAWAWVAWARPSSKPWPVESTATAELLDMFWALKGATSKPSWKRIRHRPAASTLLPAPEHVPCTMRAGALRAFWGAVGAFWMPEKRATPPMSRAFSSAVRTATRK